MNVRFTKRPLQPGMTVLEMQGVIHCGPDCARLEREIDGLIAAQETRVIFEMAGVTHLDSAAIGSIIRCLTKLKTAGGTLRIAAPHSMVAYSLKLTNVDKLIETFPTLDQAMKGFSEPNPSTGQQIS